MMLAAAAFLAVGLVGAADKKVEKKGKGPGILQPQMAVEHGTYSAPMGKLGEKPAETWTSTTTGAGVNNKPLDGKVETIVGEVIDFSCYLQLGKHGEKHRPCGQKCVLAGQPIGILMADGTMYMAMEEEHDPRRDGLTDFRKAAADHMAHIMEVTGTTTQHGGYKAIYVQGFLKK
jgi:hypothetical protein